MPKPDPKYAEPDPPLKRESRGPSQVTNLPIDALSDRDDSPDEVSGARDKVEASASGAVVGGSAAKPGEERPPFVEVSELLRERDAALETADRVANALDQLERKLETLSRERDAAVGQREEVAQRSKGRDAKGAAAQLSEMQRQLGSLRQARDDAQAHNRELGAKLSALEDELAELGYARDGARNSARQAEKEAAELIHQLEAEKQQRETNAQRIADLQQELENERRKNAELTAGNGVILAGEERAAGVADAQHLALEASAQEITDLQRDLEEERRKSFHPDATGPIAELTGLLESREHELETRARQIADLRHELEEEHRKIDELTAEKATLLSPDQQAAELAGIRQELLNISAERDAAQARADEQEAELETLRAHQQRQGTLAEQLAGLQRSRDEALTSLSAAQKQIDHIIRERDLIRQQGIESTLEMETQAEVLRAQLAAVERRHSEADKRIEVAYRERDDALVKASQFEKQRLQAIDFAAQLEIAKRDLIKLSVDLAEARLLAKFGGGAGGSGKSRKKAPVEPAEPMTVEIGLDAPSAELAAADTLPAAPAENALPAVHDPLTEKVAKRMVSAMKQCFESFSKDPSDLTPLMELQAQAQNFSEDARVSGFVALHRLGGALAALAQQLADFTELVTQSTLRTISQTIDFLGILLKQKDYAALKDPAKAVVYAVDDDTATCEAIRMSMETVMLRTQSTQEPAVALAELASCRFDLIFLDVSIPNMDGFELCQQIRHLALHARTPIVFLTGMTTIENRVQSSLSGGDDFVGKPFNLHELSVKALTLILKSSL